MNKWKNCIYLVFNILKNINQLYKLFKIILVFKNMISKISLKIKICLYYIIS